MGNGATKAHDESASQQAAANASEAATKAADGAAGAAKADTAGKFAGTSYTDKVAYPAAEAAKNAADAKLAANDARVAWEKDQLERGQNQDRSKKVNENTSAKTSEINGKHDERERANGRLLKAIASF